MTKEMTIREAARMGGIARHKALSPERRSEIAKLAGEAGKGIVGRRGWVKGKPRKVPVSPVVLPSENKAK